MRTSQLVEHMRDLQHREMDAAFVNFHNKINRDNFRLQRSMAAARIARYEENLVHQLTTLLYLRREISLFPQGRLQYTGYWPIGYSFRRWAQSSSLVLFLLERICSLTIFTYQF
jgi:hypothetical protein